MSNVLRIALLLLFFSLAAALPAAGKKENKNSPVQEDKNTVVQVSGRVRLVGSEPFPELVITGPEREWYIDKDDEHKFKELQHRTVTVEGSETIIELIFANGRPAGERRTLKDIRILEIR